MSVLFVEYPKCSTCKKAKKWLVEHNIAFFDRHIVEDNPSKEELMAIGQGKKRPAAEEVL